MKPTHPQSHCNDKRKTRSSYSQVEAQELRSMPVVSYHSMLYALVRYCPRSEYCSFPCFKFALDSQRISAVLFISSLLEYNHPPSPLDYPVKSYPPNQTASITATPLNPSITKYSHPPTIPAAQSANALPHPSAPSPATPRPDSVSPPNTPPTQPEETPT